jgi:hypothetical protein
LVRIFSVSSEIEKIYFMIRIGFDKSNGIYVVI